MSKLNKYLKSIVGGKKGYKKLAKSIAKEWEKCGLLYDDLSNAAGGAILNNQKKLLGQSMNVGGSHNNPTGNPFNPTGEIIEQSLPNHSGHGTVTVREPNGQLRRYNVYKGVNGQLFNLGVTGANRFPIP